MPGRNWGWRAMKGVIKRSGPNGGCEYAGNAISRQPRMTGKTRLFITRLDATTAFAKDGPGRKTPPGAEVGEEYHCPFQAGNGPSHATERWPCVPV
jgi:hypothetical protein